MKDNILIIGSRGKIGTAVKYALSMRHHVYENDISLSNNTNKADDFDYIVTALPAKISFDVLKNILATTTGKTIVDVSYMEEDPFGLDQIAKQNKHTVIVDAGLAPGLTNLLTGFRFVKDGYIEIAKLYVGGVAPNIGKYRVSDTWNTDDLYAEYTRPARYIKAASIVTEPPFQDIEKIKIPGVGQMEAFISDGCRTLLQMGAYDLVEKTLRWPGEIAQIQDAVSNKTFDKIERVVGQDRVVLYCEINDHVYQMTDSYTEPMTAMQRTTGFTAATFLETAMNIKMPCGIITPEMIGQNIAAFYSIMEKLKTFYSINISQTVKV